MTTDIGESTGGSGLQWRRRPRRSSHRRRAGRAGRGDRAHGPLLQHPRAAAAAGDRSAPGRPLRARSSLPARPHRGAPAAGHDARRHRTLSASSCRPTSRRTTSRSSARWWPPGRRTRRRRSTREELDRRAGRSLGEEDVDRLVAMGVVERGERSDVRLDPGLLRLGVQLLDVPVARRRSSPLAPVLIEHSRSAAARASRGCSGTGVEPSGSGVDPEHGGMKSLSAHMQPLVVQALVTAFQRSLKDGAAGRWLGEQSARTRPDGTQVAQSPPPARDPSASPRRRRPGGPRQRGSGPAASAQPPRPCAVRGRAGLRALGPALTVRGPTDAGRSRRPGSSAPRTAAWPRSGRVREAARPSPPSPPAAPAVETLAVPVGAARGRAPTKPGSPPSYPLMY